MRRIVITALVAMIFVLTFTYVSSAEMYDWYEDPRVYSEIDDSGFGFYGIDECVYIGNSFMIFIHYEPDFSGGWCKWCEYDAEGEEWFREKTERVCMSDLSRTVDAWGTFLLTEIDLRNEKA